MTGVLPASGVGAFMPGSTSGGQITPLDWPSLSPSVWLLRSCSEQAFESVVCAAAGAAIASASAAETAILMILFMRNQPRRRHAVPGARLKASAASKLQEAFTHSIWALMALR